MLLLQLVVACSRHHYGSLWHIDDPHGDVCLVEYRESAKHYELADR